jgi:hypothetical protein
MSSVMSKFNTLELTNRPARKVGRLCRVNEREIAIALTMPDQVTSWNVGNPYLIALGQSCP